jgi:uroporphyrinogen-III synthase
MRAIVTRPRAQAEAWVARLHERGVAAVALPLIAIEPAADEQAVQQAWAQLAQQALVVFVSPNAVDAFFAQRPQGATWPAGVLAASIGPGTSAALGEHGVAEVAIVQPAADSAHFDSEALWEQLRARSWSGRDVLIVRGDGGRDWLLRTLQQHGARVQALAAYRRAQPRADAATQALIESAQQHAREHVWLFSSSEAIENLMRLAPQGDWRASVAITTHPRIGQTARHAGFGTVREARPGLDAAVQALAELARHERSSPSGGCLQSRAS